LERRRGGARRWAAIGLAEHWRDWRILLAAVLGSRFAMDGLILRTLAMAVVAMALLGRLHQADVIDGGACF